MPLESSIVAAIRRFLKKEGVDVEKTHGDFYGQGGKADLYTLVVVNYQIFPVPVYLELKQPGKVSTPLQLAWARNKRKYGAIVEEVHSVEEVRELIQKVKENTYAFIA